MQFLTKYLNRVDLDLTGMCNRSCSFCPRSGDYPNINRHMSMETIDIVLRELRSINFKGVIELAGRGESAMHKNFKGIVEALTPDDKTWELRLTTNGYRIEKWWHNLADKFDSIILNTYTDEKEFEERKVEYAATPRGILVEHHFKPDGLSVEEINKLPPHEDTVTGVKFKYAFNNRAGWFSNDMISEPCWHPMRQIFIDFDGNYQMCCNDWTYQIKIGNIHERSLIDMYINDPKLNRIRWALINGRRDLIKPCAECNDCQGSKKHVKSIIANFKITPEYKDHVHKIASSEGAKYKKLLLSGK
jgi:sulfatase maturation enzyme AslB (radical SAM superfamily)